VRSPVARRLAGQLINQDEKKKPSSCAARLELRGTTACAGSRRPAEVPRFRDRAEIIWLCTHRHVQHPPPEPAHIEADPDRALAAPVALPAGYQR